VQVGAHYTHSRVRLCVGLCWLLMPGSCVHFHCTRASRLHLHCDFVLSAWRAMCRFVHRRNLRTADCVCADAVYLLMHKLFMDISVASSTNSAL
jgi:hypothetical protein